MKKILSILFILVLILNVSGCFKKDTMEGIIIYTTVYPIEYITNFLYGEHAEIISIYPSNVDVISYKLTNKQLQDYSQGGLYIYNGLSNEKNYAIEMLNINRKLKIIDGAMNMEYSYGMEELWLDPSNFLMLAQNIKMGFEEYITNPYLKNEINNNYENIKIKLSEIDAELNLIARNAENKTLIVSNNVFLFLEKYGFEVISLEESALSARKISDVREMIEKGKIKYIFVKSDQDINDTITEFINTYEVELQPLNTGTNLTEQERQERINFIDVMNKNIDFLQKQVY